ncbi:MAG: nuclear transport factor 2 family protein [Verrucomicrobiota bacterium]
MTAKEFMRTYETATGSHGLDHMVKLIDKYAVYWFSDGSSHVGKQAVEAAIKNNFEIIKDETYQISHLVCLAESRELAVCIYRFDWSGLVRGKAASGSGRGTTVLAREGDSWVVIHEHLSKGSHELEQHT